MSGINMSEWVKKTIFSRKKSVMPILSSLGYTLIGKDIIDGIFDGEIQYQAIKALHDIYPFTAVPMMMDLSVESESFGAEIRFLKNEIPFVVKPVIRSIEEIHGLEVPAFGKRIKEYVKAAGLCAINLTDRPVFAGCIGPFSLAGRLYGMTEIMTDMIMDEEEIMHLLEICTSFLEHYIDSYKKSGVSGIIIAEPAAGMLSPEMCGRFSSDFISRMVNKFQDDKFIVILHNCGNTGILNGTMQSTGAKALHLSSNNDLKKTLNEVQADTLIMGNIDPTKIIKNGNPGIIRDAVLKILHELKDHDNFILSSGCDIPPGIAGENIDAFFGAFEEYNSKL